MAALLQIIIDLTGSLSTKKTFIVLAVVIAVISFIKYG